MNLSALTKSTLAVISFITIVGGAVWGLGKPPYANRVDVNQQIAGLNLQYYQTKEDQLRNRIFDLKVQKRKMGSRWPDFMQKELERKEKELQRIEEKIQQYLK